MYAYVARQPIIGKDRHVAGYELFYRDVMHPNSAGASDGDLATLIVLSNAVDIFGLRELTGGLPAYVNFTRNMLLNDLAGFVDSKDIAIEVMEDVAVDEELVDRLHGLKKAGFRLVMQKYSGQKKFRRLTPLFDVVRIDFSRLNSIRRREMAFHLAGPNMKLLGEHVESMEDYYGARQMGYSLFQGYYLGRPKLCRKELPPLRARSCGRVIEELMEPFPHMYTIQGILENDIALSFLILQQVRRGARRSGSGKKPAGDIRNVLETVPRDDLLRYTLVAMVRRMNVTGSDQVPRHVLTRARFVELLVVRTSSIDPRNGFLLGLFSKMEELSGENITLLLAGMRLDPELIAALNPISRDSRNIYCKYLDFVDIFEMSSEKLRLPPLTGSGGELPAHVLRHMYENASQEADEMLENAGIH